MGKITNSDSPFTKILVPFLFIGAASLAAAAVSVVSSLRFSGSAIRAEGVVVRVEQRRSSRKSGGYTYYPVIQFETVDRQKVQFTSSFGTPPMYSVGKRVTVLHARDDIQNARIDSFFALYLTALITGFVGLIFTAISTGFLVVIGRQRKKREWLERNGESITARVTRVELNRSLSVNGRHPWVIHAEWESHLSGRLQTFKSHSIWTDPPPATAGSTVEVLIDLNNPSRYWVRPPEQERRFAA